MAKPNHHRKERLVHGDDRRAHGECAERASKVPPTRADDLAVHSPCEHRGQRAVGDVEDLREPRIAPPHPVDAVLREAHERDEFDRKQQRSGRHERHRRVEPVVASRRDAADVRDRGADHQERKRSPRLVAVKMNDRRQDTGERQHTDAEHEDACPRGQRPERGDAPARHGCRCRRHYGPITTRLGAPSRGLREPAADRRR